MDRNELKIQALLEKISELTTQHENQAAEYRVDITLLANEKQELANELAEVRKELEEALEVIKKPVVKRVKKATAAKAGEDVPQETDEASSE